MSLEYEGPVTTYTLTDRQIAEVAREAIHSFTEGGQVGQPNQIFDRFSKLEFYAHIRHALQRLIGTEG